MVAVTKHHRYDLTSNTVLKCIHVKDRDEPRQPGGAVSVKGVVRVVVLSREHRLRSCPCVTRSLFGTSRTRGNLGDVQICDISLLFK